jgi:N-acetylglutamate synthase-like GNAT family acetyltransferase
LLGKIKLRTASEADAAPIVAFCKLSILEGTSQYYTTVQLRRAAAAYEIHKISTWIETCGILCAHFEGVLVGCVILDKDYVKGLFVHPDYRKKGIGARLLKRGNALARTRGIRIQLVCSALNAQNFYVKNGFQTVSQVPSPNYDVVFMFKLLRPLANGESVRFKGVERSIRYLKVKKILILLLRRLRSVE